MGSSSDMANVWIVKLSPSGGLLKNKENRLKDYGVEKEFKREELKTYDEKRIPEYCKEKNIIAIGWALPPKKSWKSPSKGTISLRVYRKKYGKKISRPVNTFHQIKNGDICWVRDAADTYYVCKIRGYWKYNNSKEAWAMDLVQRYSCSSWVKVGDSTEAPSAVVRKLITIGDTVRKIDTTKDREILHISEFLLNEKGKIESLASKFSPDDIDVDYIEKQLDPYFYEDLVGMYLQSKGNFILPSTRSQSTKAYEFVMLNKEGKKSVVQAKYKDSLDASEFEEMSKTYRVYLACRGDIKNIDEGNDNIVQIKNADLVNFLKEYPNLLPKWIRFLLAYRKTFGITTD